MTRFMDKSFSTYAPGDSTYVERWEATFGKPCSAEARPSCGSHEEYSDGCYACRGGRRRPDAQPDRLRALLATWLDGDEEGSLWSDWPKRLEEHEREALAAAWTGQPVGSCWTRRESAPTKEPK